MERLPGRWEVAFAVTLALLVGAAMMLSRWLLAP
jgi:hypothetical protein